MIEYTFVFLNRVVNFIFVQFECSFFDLQPHTPHVYFLKSKPDFMSEECSNSTYY